MRTSLLVLFVNGVVYLVCLEILGDYAFHTVKQREEIVVRGEGKICCLVLFVTITLTAPSPITKIVY